MSYTHCHSISQLPGSVSSRISLPATQNLTPTSQRPIRTDPFAPSERCEGVVTEGVDVL